ncbi:MULTISPECIES: hypothetical protein [Enterovibrio]|uniref:hypothetical protein n=1 Tax=Enterovibrio TaxID=188143 RepID=UPI00114D3C15|nr:hypothetical protein [Enterovibrio norvegicus]
MKNTYLKNIILACSVSLLAACSQTPPEVNATIPLLSPVKSHNHQRLPADMEKAIDKGQIEISSPNGSQYQVGEHYFSALGYECRQLKAVDIYPVKSEVICRIDQQWALMPPVVEMDASMALFFMQQGTVNQ